MNTADYLQRMCMCAAGTPIQNDLSEFHAVFDLACPGLLGTLNTFRKMYEGPIQRGRDADATDKQVGPACLRACVLMLFVSCHTQVQARSLRVVTGSIAEHMLPLRSAATPCLAGMHACMHVCT